MGGWGRTIGWRLRTEPYSEGVAKVAASSGRIPAMVPPRPARRSDRRSSTRRSVLGGERLEPRAMMAIAVSGALPDLILAPSAAPAPIDTAAEFSVSGVNPQGTVVKFAMQAGDDATVRPLFIELYDKEIRGANNALVRSAAPVSTANFLSYVSATSYDSTFIHRATDFAGDAGPARFLQGGGYTNIAGKFGYVATGSPIKLEWAADRPNAAGTIAYARTSDVDSATSGFFFNVTANSMFDAPGNQYAAFGKVVGDGLQVLADYAKLTRVNAGSPLETLPVSDVSGISWDNLPNRLLMVRSASVVAAPQTAFGVAASSADPAIATVKVDAAGRLVLAAGATHGTTTITVTGTDLSGATVTDQFTVSVGVPAIGVTTAGAAIASGQAAAIPLGSAVKGAVSATTTFTVSNPGDVALALQSPTLPAGVKVVTALPASIPAGGSAQLVVSLDTALVRAVTGSITIPSSAPAGTFAIPVSGSVYSKPDAPTGVSSFWAAATRVTVSWTAAVSNGSALTVSSIFALQVGTQQWVKVADNIPGTATTFDVPVTIVGGKSIPDITQGWAFKVASRNAAGVSPLSSGGKYLMAPVAPASVVAAAAGPGTALVTWEHAVQPWDSIDKTYRPLTGYVLFYRQPGSATWTRFGDLPVVTSATVTGLVPGKSYQFTLRAKSDSGGSLLSKVSNTLTIA